MQGTSSSEVRFLDAGALCRHLVPEGSVHAFLADHRGDLFPDEVFADLFPSGRGRPSVPADVMASAMVLQALEGLSDREAAEALRRDIGWKVACGLALDHGGIHFTVFTYWRKRLAGSGRPHRIREAVGAVVDATGVLGGKRRRALDSTLLDDAVATQDTVTQLISAVRRVRRVVPEAGAVEVCAHDYDSAGKPMIAWDDPVAKDALVTGLVNDALGLLGALSDLELGAEGADALGLLALVAGQDVEPGDGDGTWRIARGVAPDRVISTVDPEARHMHKSRSAHRDGYKAHVAVEPETGLVTAACLTPANAPDGPTGVELVAGEGDDLQVLADSAYGSGETRAALSGSHRRLAIKAIPLRVAVPGGFNRDDFSIDHDARTATCPAGHTITIAPKGSATFGARCGPCPLRERCTTAQTGRTLQIGPHDRQLVEARRAWRDGDFIADYRQWRPMVERSIAWLATGPNRRVRYRGVERNNAWLGLRVAAINLRRLINLGLTRDGPSWALP
ncbi:MAG: IS1182 family transposase [Actinobacteria bacterium]|nr:IS1182 family transposase [Actinomycetota bacterium]MBU1492612.1 IS1182 family transposase [Actinomycetota bacterium]